MHPVNKTGDRQNTIQYLPVLYLFSLEFNLKILRRLLGHSSAKIQLINLTVFVPQWGFIVQNKFAPSFRLGRRLAFFNFVGCRRILFGYPSLSQLKNGKKVIRSNKKLSKTNWKYLIEQLGFLKTFEIVEIVYCCSLRVVDIIV
jgi:hypothetical protein